jgi:hypothetical protein
MCCHWTLELKVPSGQIRSHMSVPLVRPWKGHQPLYVIVFQFNFWIFEKTSKFWAASYKNVSNLLLVRITVCIESFPIGWRTFIWWKSPPKFCTILVWIAGCRILQIFFSRAVKSFQIFKTKSEKSKRYSGWWLFKGLSNYTTLMQIQSGWTVPFI